MRVLSFRKDILRLVQANPGLGLVELGKKLKLRTAAKRQRLSTQLSIECGKKNLRRTGKPRNFHFFPNKKTQAALDRPHGRRVTVTSKLATKRELLPNSRTARILDVLRKSAAPLTLGAVASAIPAETGKTWAKHSARISAALCILVQTDRAQRVGPNKNYHYAPADRDISSFIVPAPVRVAPKKSAAAPKPASRIVIAPSPMPITAPAPKAAPFETVDQFLKRGGRIEQLPNGASSEPLRITRTDIDDANWRRRLARESESQ